MIKNNFISINDILEVSKIYNFKNNKNLGQNFLIDQNIINKIFSKIENKNIIEIGTGFGSISNFLYQKNNLITIEKDLRLKKIHQDLMPHLNVIYKDALKVEFNKLFKNNEKIVIISNLPYYITSKLILKSSFLNCQVEFFLFMFQKEFFEKLIDEKNNFINVYLNTIYVILKINNIKKECFFPKPKVDSVIVKFIPKEISIDKKQYFNFLRDIFNKKRKTLKNILKKEFSFINFNDELIKDKLNLRIEDLKKEDFLFIFKLINKKEN